MPDLCCKCGHKIAEYDDYEIHIKDKKCKTVTVLHVVNGKLARKLDTKETLEAFRSIESLIKSIKDVDIMDKINWEEFYKEKNRLEDSLIKEVL